MRFTNLLSVHPVHVRANTTPRMQPRQNFVRAATDPQCVLTVDGTYSSQAACLSGTTCGWKYKCSAGSCTRAPDGTYATQADCFAACSKWGCDGSGTCVPRMDGTYNSPSECRCFSCANNSCAPVAANAKGTYASLNECQYDATAQCGWTYGCASAADGGDAASFCKKVPQPMGSFATAADCRCVTALGAPGPSCTCGYDPAAPADKTKYASLTTCRQGPTDRCGWNYGCSSPLTISYPAGNRAAQRYNSGTGCAGGFPCAQYLYFLVGEPFIAYKPVGRFTIGNGNIGVSGGSGNDWSEADYVVIAYGNYEVGKPDPTTATYTSPKNGQSINVGADVIIDSTTAKVAKRTINGRDTQPVAGWNNVSATLKVGWQYALCYRLYSQCDEMTAISWGASTVTLSDA
jgi:hypothetical protein